MNRLFGILITGAWLLAMAALIRRDMIPYWTAQDTPTGLLPAGDYQIAIRNASSHRMGTTWVSMRGGPESTVSSTTEFEIAGLQALLPGLKFLILDSSLTYAPDGALDAFKFALHGADIPIQVSGERYVRDFACTARFGSVTRTLPLDAGVSRALSDSVRPFTHLKDLQVGQSWRLRLLDPLALVREAVTGSAGVPPAPGSVGVTPARSEPEAPAPGHSGNTSPSSLHLEFQTQVAKVVARETIQHDGQPVECFRIETPTAVAWAADDGRVIRQQVTLPLLGKWTLEEEPFDAKARQLARAKTRQSEVAHDATIVGHPSPE